MPFGRLPICQSSWHSPSAGPVVVALLLRMTCFGGTRAPSGTEIEFPDEIVDEDAPPLMRFDPAHAEVHERVARIVSGG